MERTLEKPYFLFTLKSKSNNSTKLSILHFTVNEFSLIKKRFCNLLLASIIILCSYTVSASIYYVSTSSGNDSNSGTSENTPWQSLSKVNSFTPSPGDQILFKRGDEWVGTITLKASGTASNQITYGAYGSGEKPIIYGSEILTGWTQHSGNIYKKTINFEIKQLFFDGERASLARYPKTGWLDVTTANNTIQFVSTELKSQPTDYYKDAIFVCRPNPYIINKRTVNASGGQTLTIDAAPPATMSVGDGFFLADKLDFLTQAGEWCFDTTTNTIYAWMPNSDAPSNYTIRASKEMDGINTNNKTYITIDGLEFKHQALSAVYIYEGDNCSVKNCVINDVVYGVYGGGSVNNTTVEDNIITGAYLKGIYIAAGANCKLNGNTIYETGKVASMNRIGFYDNAYPGTAIMIGRSGAASSTISYNKIYNSGYAGIVFYSGVHHVHHNVVDGALLELDDGGAIYTFNDLNNYSQAGAAGSIVENNIVLNVLGNHDGTTYTTSQAHGIYLDNKTHDIIVRKNLIACSSHGINLHDGGRNLVENNIFFDNIIAINGSNQQEKSTIKNNLIFATNRNHKVLFNITYPRLVDQRGTADNEFDQNTYIVPYNETSVFVQYNNFESWKAAGKDINSIYDGSDIATGEKEELFYNDTKQLKSFDLGSSVYRDINGKEVTGTFNLEPFTSRILIKTTKTIELNKKPVIQGQSFNIETDKKTNDLIGKVQANDPDLNQSLTFAIIQGNEENLFYINPSTGDFYANTNITANKNTTIILDVEVTDNAITPLSETANISINIVNIAPSFSEYLFEESSGNIVLDSNGSNDGTIINGATRTEGVLGEGLQFNGSEYVTVGQSFGNNVQLEVTLSVWIKPVMSGSYQGIIMHGGPNTDTYALYVYPDAKTIGFKTTGTSSAWVGIENVTDLWDGNWHQLTATYNGIDKIVYLDGVVISNVSATGNIESGAGYNLLIGAGRDEASPGLLYQGLLDEVRIYNYALTGSEITELYNQVNTVKETAYTTEDISICEGSSYRGWFSSGQYQRILIANSGADSIVTTYLEVNPVYNITENVIINKGENYMGWTETGAYENTYSTINGCDSIVITVLTVNSPVFTSEYITINEGEEYKGWNEPGEYVQNLSSVTGGDSIVTVYLKVAQIISTIEDISICEGYSYQGWTSEGQFQRVLQSVLGSDSIVTTNLTLIPTQYFIEELTIVEGENYMGWTKSGEYTRTLSSVNNCDSIVTTKLIVNPILRVVEYITICEGEDYCGWTTDGEFERILTSISGYDSIVTTHLKVASIIRTTEDISICQGSSYLEWTNTGEYHRTLKAVTGADSIVITNLHVNPLYNIAEKISIQEGEDYFGWNTTGEYSRTLTSVTGCDSIVTTSLSVISNTFSVAKTVSSTEEISICEGNSYQGWKSSGQYQRVLQTATGADSIITTILQVIPTQYVTETITISDGENYMGWTKEGEYTRTLTSLFGCDSIVTTNLSVLKPINTFEEIAICAGDSYQNWTSTGQYQRILQTVDGNDSIVTTNLIINPVYNINEEVTIQEGEYYMNWNETGEYQRTLNSVTGCDSIIITNLIVSKSIEFISQSIDLKKGWNNFSSFVVPANRNIDAVVRTLYENGQLVSVIDENGNTYQKMGKNWINNIGELLETEGYKIKVKSDHILEIKGQPVKLPLEITIKHGSNLISFPVNGSVDAMKVIQPLIDAGILDKVQDERGNSIEYWGPALGWVNGIGNFNAGEGYLLLANKSGVLTIKDISEKSSKSFANNFETTYFKVNYEGNGSNHMNINIEGLIENHFQVGDEIAAFDGEICVGAVKLNESNIAKNAVSVHASISDENLSNGFIEGNSIELRFWKATANGEVQLFPEVIEGSFIFNSQASVFVELNNQTTNINEEYNDINVEVYPNPARNNVTVNFSNLPLQSTQIILLDITGKQLVNQVVKSTKEILDIQSFSAGIYFVNTIIGDSRTVKKLIIN